MTARAYVLIFFFWTILAVITPTLIFLSENSKHGDDDSTSERSAEIKARKMQLRSLALAAASASAPASAPVPAPASALAMRASVVVAGKRAERYDYNFNSKQDVLYKEILAQMLFEV